MAQGLDQATGPPVTETVADSGPAGRGSVQPLPHARVAAGLQRSNSLGASTWADLAAALDLSDRQLDIAQCIFDGLTEPDMGRLLGVSDSTIHTHLDRLYRKLHVHGRCELVVALFRAYVSLTASEL